MISSKEKALAEARSTIKSLRAMIDHFEDSIEGTNETHQHETFISLKALDAFMSEEAGFSFWCFKIREIIFDYMSNFKNLH